MNDITNGDIFRSGCQVLVNPVNCRGVMGTGLAQQFKMRYPDYTRQYESLCKQEVIQPGSAYFHPVTAADNTHVHTDIRFIVSFATKNDWRAPSRLEWIEDGMASLVEGLLAYQVISAAIPALGCGAGQLSWQDVLPVIQKYIVPIKDINFRIYSPPLSGVRGI